MAQWCCVSSVPPSTDIQHSFIHTRWTFTRTFNYLVVLHFYRGLCNNFLLYYHVMSFFYLLLQLFMNSVVFSLFTLLALVLSYGKHPEYPVITSLADICVCHTRIFNSIISNLENHWVPYILFYYSSDFYPCPPISIIKKGLTRLADFFWFCQPPKDPEQELN
jgi:hypothetical protein